MCKVFEKRIRKLIDMKKFTREHLQVLIEKVEMK